MSYLSLLTPYLRENRSRLMLGLGCLMVVDILQLLIPRVIKWAVDDVTAYRTDFRGLMMYAGYIVGIAVLIGVFRYGWRRWLMGTSRRVEEGLRNQLFEHIQRLSAPYFNRTKTGDVMAHATNDINHIRMATGMGLVALTDAVVLGAAAVGFMAYINLRLTLLVLIPAPLMVLGARFFSRRMHRHYQAVQAAFSDLTEMVREQFAGIRIVKAYGREAAECRKLAAASREYVGKNVVLMKYIGSFFPLMVFFSNLSLVLVLYFGGRQTIRTAITPGDFVAFISYLALLTWPMMAMGWVTNLIQRGRASLERIQRILETPPDIVDAPDALAVDRAAGGIVFEQVQFAYAKGGAPVLAGVSFSLAPGRTLGIMGPPGSGKTTLLKLLPRIFDVSAGRVRIDGADVRRLRLEDLRRQIAFVHQEPFLFAGTIRENLTLDPAVSEAELVRACRAASLYHTVESFPHGLDTLVGEKGVILSGGQKQRVGLARALLHNAPILVLDDPISQVDADTGRRILDNLKQNLGRRTLVIVSHRIAAVRFADRILTLENGRIAEDGTHDELLANDGYYAQTFRLQEIEEAFNAA